MQLSTKDQTLIITELPELTAAQAPQVKKALHQAFTASHKDAVLHCESLEFLDSTGLGVLISLHNKASKDGGQLTLRHPNAPILQLLELTRLDRLFHIVTA